MITFDLSRSSQEALERHIEQCRRTFSQFVLYMRLDRVLEWTGMGDQLSVSRIFPVPKSVIFILKLSSSKMFSGLRSLGLGPE